MENNRERAKVIHGIVLWNSYIYLTLCEKEITMPLNITSSVGVGGPSPTPS